MMYRRYVGPVLRALRPLAAVVLTAVLAAPAAAVPVFTGGNGVVSFGVANYGGPPIAAPTYILNNFTGLADVLTSPGHGFLTANTSIANNIASYGPAGIPGGAFQLGGGNGNGAFGFGQATITGPGIGFNLTDINPDGIGAAAYMIASWNASFTNVGAWVGTIGNFLSVSGLLQTPQAAIAVSLRTTLVSPTLGVLTLPQLVLAASGVASGFNFQALGGPLGLNAAMVINPITGQFSGLAINNLGLAVIPNGEVILATTTLTAIADPAMLDSIIDLNLLPLTGTSLPDFSFVSASTPEPSTWIMLSIGAGAFAVRELRRRRAA